MTFRREPMDNPYEYRAPRRRRRRPGWGIWIMVAALIAWMLVIAFRS